MTPGFLVKPGAAVGLGVSPVILDVSQYLESQSATGICAERMGILRKGSAPTQVQIRTNTSHRIGGVSAFSI